MVMFHYWSESSEGQGEGVSVTSPVQELHHVSQGEGHSTHHLPFLSQRFQGNAEHTPGGHFRLQNRAGSDELRADLRAGPHDSDRGRVVLQNELL